MSDFSKITAEAKKRIERGKSFLGLSLLGDATNYMFDEVMSMSSYGRGGNFAKIEAEREALNRACKEFNIVGDDKRAEVAVLYIQKEPMMMQQNHKLKNSSTYNKPSELSSLDKLYQEMKDWCKGANL